MYATTFGSSRLNHSTKEYQDGIKIGAFLAQKGFTVKCGGYGGLMEAVSRGVKEEGGVCIGYGLAFFDARRPKNPYIDEMVVCEDLFDRIRGLVEKSKLFIIQMGEIGTLNELFYVWCLKYAKIDTDFRICVIGCDWSELIKLPMVSEENFAMLELYEDGDDFIKRVFDAESI